MHKVDLDALAIMRDRGGTWAVYENKALDSSNAGHLQFLQVGEKCTYKDPPNTYPADTAYGMGWKYVFIGFLDPFLRHGLGCSSCDPEGVKDVRRKPVDLQRRGDREDIQKAWKKYKGQDFMMIGLVFEAFLAGWDAAWEEAVKEQEGEELEGEEPWFVWETGEVLHEREFKDAPSGWEKGVIAGPFRRKADAEAEAERRRKKAAGHKKPGGSRKHKSRP